MTIYPVFIPTLNRYAHFKRCVESLARNVYASETELVIGLDFPPAEKYREGWEKIKNYLPTIEGFKKVTVFTHDKNVGARENWQVLQDYCFYHYDAAIVSEDDNEFSPCFLEYINTALNRFRDDETIKTVSGYNAQPFYDQNGHTVYKSIDNNAWGFGLWKHKEAELLGQLNNNLYFINAIHKPWTAKRILDTYPTLYLMLTFMVRRMVSYGDVKRTTLNILKGTYQLRPSVSLVRNWGFDGSGTNCENEQDLHLQPISEDTRFEFPDAVGSFETSANYKHLKEHCLPADAEERKQHLALTHQFFKENTSITVWPRVIVKNAFASLRVKLGIGKRIEQFISLFRS